MDIKEYYENILKPLRIELIETKMKKE